MPTNKTQITYKVMYWLGGRRHYTAPTYATLDSAKKGLSAFRNKYPSKVSRVVKQTVVGF